MFKTDGEPNQSALKLAVDQADKNYIITKNDLLDIQVYTNNGERLIDPNYEFEVGGGGNNQNLINRETARPRYLVQRDGYVRLPMLGKVKLDGYTLNEADSILQKEYSEYYKDAFVYTKYLNKRVFILGAIGGVQGGGGLVGGGGRVVALENEDMTLIEVLTSVGGVSGSARVGNIRLIRGDLKDPYVEVIDLSTIQGMKKATLKLEPMDVIYIEPLRRPFLEAFRDYSSLVSFITGLASLTLSTIILVNSLKK